MKGLVSPRSRRWRIETRIDPGQRLEHRLVERHRHRRLLCNSRQRRQHRAAGRAQLVSKAHRPTVVRESHCVSAAVAVGLTSGRRAERRSRDRRSAPAERGQETEHDEERDSQVASAPHGKRSTGRDGDRATALRRTGRSVPPLTEAQRFRGNASRIIR